MKFIWSFTEIGHLVSGIFMFVVGFGWLGRQTQGLPLGFQRRNHRDPNKQKLYSVEVSYYQCLSHTRIVYMDRPKEMLIKEVIRIRTLFNVKASIKGFIGNFPIHNFILCAFYN
jgi:hypothetical protein